MSFTLTWMAHQAHVRYFEDLDRLRLYKGYSSEYWTRAALDRAKGSCERDTPAGRIAVTVSLFQGFNRRIRRHTRESWTLDGKRISEAKLAALLQPFEPVEEEGAPLDQDRRPLGAAVSGA